jgi:hypothetical protein
MTIDELIATMAETLQSGHATLATGFTGAEWRMAVRNAFGPALIQIDLASDKKANAKLVLAEVQKTLARETTSQGARIRVRMHSLQQPRYCRVRHRSCPFRAAEGVA